MGNRLEPTGINPKETEIFSYPFPRKVLKIAGMKIYPSIGIQIPQILLPVAGIDLRKWAVIACDQFTSEPEYWQEVQELVGDAPSTYHLILPEILLGTAAEETRVASTQAAMRSYLAQGWLSPHDGMILVQRTAEGRTRHGIMLALDLECYDYTRGSQTLMRATEGTILDRLPPRMRIRRGAALELPHILVLIDDPHGTVIEPLVARKTTLPRLYDTDLMLGSGHVSAYSLSDPTLEAGVVQALGALADPNFFQSRYGVGQDKHPLLFAMGDGNHSFATAKAIWEELKPHVGMDHPARYALVEIENVHDQGLEFEPIHRVLFGLCEEPLAALRQAFGDSLRVEPCAAADAMIAAVNAAPAALQTTGLVTEQGAWLLHFTQPTSNLPVGTLQTFLDGWLKQGGAEKIDYVHGDDVVCRLGALPGQAGFYLPAMSKEDLFKTVILDGALPRKTFSMGAAREKRFYLESRRIA